MYIYREEYAGGPKHPMRNHNPFSASGTATFPTHRFVFTPENDPNTILKLFIVSEYPNNLYFYDPYYVENDPIATEQNLHGNLTKNEREMYDMWYKTKLYNEYYINKTGRSYLANYLRPPPTHFMWRGDYFDQIHSITTQETHFITEPPKKKLQPITERGMKRRFVPNATRILSEYRNTEPLNLTLRVISVVPRAFQIDNFLSSIEVDHITELASGIKLSLSGTGEAEPGEKGINEAETVSNVKKTRTSYNSWVKRERSPIIDAVYRRAADLLKIDEALLRQRDVGEVPERDDHLLTLAEDLQLVNYKVSQEYTSHHDFGYSRIGREEQGARFATLLLYLNEGMVGGETSFPRYANAESFRELKVVPKIGKAILFYSQLPDGNLDDFSQHAALPVIDGEKVLYKKKSYVLFDVTIPFFNFFHIFFRAFFLLDFIPYNYYFFANSTVGTCILYRKTNEYTMLNNFYTHLVPSNSFSLLKLINLWVWDPVYN
jgi:prolyl 4-hydroxylase